MENINKRIDQVISASGLSKTAFAKRINVSQPFVSQMISGTAKPSDRTITDICREFAINETWLRTGEGQMQEDRTRRDEILEVMGKVAALPEDSPEFFMMGVLADMLSKIDSKYWAEIAEKVVDRAEAYKEAKKNEAP